MNLKSRFATTGLSLWVCAAAVSADDAPSPEHDFARDVRPFLEKHCVDCHGGSDPEGKLSFEKYQDSGNVQKDYETWERVLLMVGERQMPPVDMPQPTDDEADEFLKSIRAELATFDCSQVLRPGRVTVRRLNRAEYNNTIRDLIGIDFHPADDFPSDDVGYGFDNIGDVLSMPPLLVEKYLDAAEAVIDAAYADDAARSRILRHTAGGDVSERDAARLNLSDFVEHAFRRPPSDREFEQLRELTRIARRNGLSDEEGFRGALTAVLVSPKFLFRIERDPGDDDENGIRNLDGWELATRLSYFLWSSMPDEELFTLAREGKLQNDEVLVAQARRMLDDPKARALIDNFAGQWLQLRDLARLSPDPELFPEFDEPLRAAMREETEHFFANLIENDRSVLEFLTADYSFLNERLANHYGIEGVQGDQFRRVDLPEQRRGVLTQASILLITSNPTRTSPVKRGKWILENVLAEPPPPPPGNVPALDANAETLGTLRERMEQHRENPSCAVCHFKMDSLGFGLENFDAVGAWRTVDGRADIDPAGELPGGVTFNGPAELMAVLADEKKEAFCRCLTEKLLTYGLGRGLQSYDRCAVNKIVERLEKNEYRFRALVDGVVLSDAFRMRESAEEQ